MKYKVIICGESVVTWTGFINSDCIENAQKAACKIAENMGGSFLNILKVEPVND